MPRPKTYFPEPLNEEQREMVIENIPLVHFTLRKYFSAKMARDDDLVSAGYEGLCIAVTMYDPNRGKFSSLAVQCIRNMVRSEISKRAKHQKPTVSIDNTIDDSEDDATHGKWYGRHDDGYREAETEMDIEMFSEFLTTDELAVLEMRRRGIPTPVIIERTGICKSRVYKIINETKDLWEKYRK